MDSRENTMPAAETVVPEAPSSYQLASKNDSSTLLIGPPDYSPLRSGLPSSLVKKKRGRPRKYVPDVFIGSSGESGRTLSPIPISASAPPASANYSELKFGEPEGSSGSFPGEKKKKGRPSFSETKSKHAYGSMDLGDNILSGGSFTPHMVTINPGEDVTSKIISFTKDGPRSICIISALGVISHVTLRQASSSGGSVTYEGRFEILSLSGSFTPGEVEGVLSKESKMSIALSSSDGRVVGGQLGGLLTAAGPVQVVVASFLPNIGGPIEPKLSKQKTIAKHPTPMAPSTEHLAIVKLQNLNEQVHERSEVGNTNPNPARNFQLENHTSASVHDWRRSATDMNVSLKEE
uniref:AT-hook motif nuclear-localized protein 1-like n=1 Tax=Erigeron canadensis TaxID=72917 RepID=UPI001CB9AB01|nr:AT-hook motif nuclear-localized protein 1-like [Erigeron canadensis]XP_043622437.1 AT-hook motif nuclear-localized protein 1-like [Erigeron canadensis]